MADISSAYCAVRSPVFTDGRGLKLTDARAGRDDALVRPSSLTGVD